MAERAATTLASSERSVGDVLADIVGGVQRLVRAEVRLVTTGAVNRLKAAALGGALVVAGATGLVATVVLVVGLKGLGREP